MSGHSGPIERIAGALVRRRSSIPRWLTRVVEAPAKRPDTFLGRVGSMALGGNRRAPEPTAAPETPIRVYIGPTNYAGQGWAWSRALERADDRIGARNMSIEMPGTFAFPADRSVPLVSQNISRRWQREELAAVSKFTHVLVEAERTLFGPLFERDLDRERTRLVEAGVSVAYISHGTDIRSPRRHRDLTPWSPFAEEDEETALFQRDADANLEFLRRAGRPLFVSTPDLLLDLPEAAWCPVVVDPNRWRHGRELLSTGSVVVAHAPSNAGIKGSELIEGPMRELAASGRVTYRRIEGVRAATMPEVVGGCDILLDQFRLGSYGVGAVEAMAAGRVVIGHVLPDVRERVREATGVEVPIVEAVPDTIAGVIADLVADPARMRMVGAEGAAFVRAVHDGRRSAEVLIHHWIAVETAA